MLGRCVSMEVKKGMRYSKGLQTIICVRDVNTDKGGNVKNTLRTRGFPW